MIISIYPSSTWLWLLLGVVWGILLDRLAVSHHATTSTALTSNGYTNDNNNINVTSEPTLTSSPSASLPAHGAHMAMPSHRYFIDFRDSLP
jgi:hypothetical protein